MNLKKIAFVVFFSSIMSSAWADDALDAAMAAANDAVETANIETTNTETETSTTDDTSDPTAIDAPVIEDAAE